MHRHASCSVCYFRLPLADQDPQFPFDEDGSTVRSMWRWWTFVGDRSHCLFLSVISRKGVLFSVTQGTLVGIIRSFFLLLFQRCYPIPCCPPRILSGIMDVLPSIGDILPSRIWDWQTSRNKFRAEIIILLLDPRLIVPCISKANASTQQMYIIIIIISSAINILTLTMRLSERINLFLRETLHER